MLETVDSFELSEWMAWERANGPIGPGWRDETLAAIHDQLQLLCSLTGSAHWGEDSPIKEVEPLPRPTELYSPKDEKKSLEEEQLENVNQAAALSAAFD